MKSIFHKEKSEPVTVTTYSFVAEGFNGSRQKCPNIGFHMKATSNVEEPYRVAHDFGFGTK
jgi:hypothetical protein